MEGPHLQLTRSATAPSAVGLHPPPRQLAIEAAQEPVMSDFEASHSTSNGSSIYFDDIDDINIEDILLGD
jgi:hypothetical protein